jgi:pyruvate dehydrogenase E1 component beta subunit
MGFVGLGVGAAMCGLRPVVEVMFAEFLGVCLDQIVTEAALMRYLSGGTIGVPLTVRASAGAGLGFGAQHSQMLETWLISAPGLKVVVPSDSMSAYGLLRAAIRDEDPVVVLEPRALYSTRGPVDRGEAAIPRLGEASVLMHGDKATLVALGSTVATCVAVAEGMGGLALDVIDLQTLKPWDVETVSTSVAKTGGLVVVEESPTTGGWGTEIVARISSACWSKLRGPIARVACPDVPVPFSKSLESQYLPTEDDVMCAVGAVIRGDTYLPRWEARA